MWSLRGALRRDVRFLGREHHEMPTKVWQDPTALEPGTFDEDFGCVDDDLDEKHIPLSRSPVYPPDDSLIKGVLGLSMSEEGRERGTRSGPLTGHDNMAALNFPDDEIAQTVSVRESREASGHRRHGSSDSDLGSDSGRSDNEIEIVQGHSWKSTALTVSKEIVEEHEKKNLSRRFFATVLRDFRTLYVALSNPNEIPERIRQLSGRALTLRFPEHWYLLPQPMNEIRVLFGVDLRAYICCDVAVARDVELIPLGACAARSPDLHYRETPCAILMDTEGRFFLYDAETEGLFLAAENLVELAHKGLSACEPAYRDGGATISLPRPRTAVKKILSACVIGLESVNAAVTSVRGTAIVLCDRASGSERILQIFDASELRRKPPFSELDDESCGAMMDYVEFRLAEEWVVLGGIGTYDNSGGFVFMVDIVVLLGVTGAVYGFGVEENDVYRLADDLSTLLRRGISPEPNRFDRDALGELRLERRALCPHEREGTRGDREPVVRQVARRDLRGWLRWQLRTGPDTDRCVQFAHLEEAKRQFRHPVSSLPVCVVTGESYQPKNESEQGYGVLAEGRRNFRCPRTRPDPTDEERRRQRELYQRMMCPPGPFVNQPEETYTGVIAERAARLAALQKSGTSLRLPAISRAATRVSRRGSPMSDR
uniref:R139 protein n=1 Tax=Murid betaherpesvirus 2 TaxID=28304 RepID=Q599M1_9BETA|nr:r139 protein [Murid betaherpesvirus 2]